MSDVTIRSAVLGDIEAVEAVISRAYAPWLAKIAELPDVAAGVPEDIADCRVWVAVEAQEIRGCLIGGPESGRWHVANVAVAPDHGGKGVGRALMAFAVDQARREGLREMALATHRDMPGNVNLYERLGWVVTDESGNKIMMKRRTDL
ncbi:MAG: GNAT family N-acetyltransferase [Boseongicola sp.]|nr:GNAT family N-acetyltransferase [Boseongicola sp.]